jgi:hypothetical protein
LDISGNLAQTRYSFPLQELVTLITTGQSYKTSSKILEKFLDINLSVDTLERITKDSSRSYDDFYDDIIPEPAKEEELIVVSADGKGVPMTAKESKRIIGRPGKGEKKQKKKESLVGVCYATTPIQRDPNIVAKSLILGDVSKDEEVPHFKTETILKVASLQNPKQTVMSGLKNYCQKLSSKKIPIVLMDGAKSLWSIANTVFKDGYIGILDIIHVRDYLYEAGHLFHKEASDELRQWVLTKTKMILKGETEKVISIFRKESKTLSEHKKKKLEKIIGYFLNHLELMQYDKYLKEGYPIASGVVESACSQVVANRMELPGARWSIGGAEAVLKNRSVFTSDHWDDYWSYHKEWMRISNYGNSVEPVNNISYGVRLCG